MNLTFISYAIAAALGFGAAWTLQGRAIDALKLEHANERIAIQAAARHAIERSTSAVIAAQNNATARNAVLRADADGARSSGNGLRIATDAAVRTASSRADACPDTATAIGVVFAQCVGELQALAESADRHASDIKTLMQATKQ